MTPSARTGERPQLPLGGASLLIIATTLASLLIYGACGRHASRFSTTFESPQDLASAVLEAAQAHDRQALERLALSESEFRDEVYPEMPAFGRIPLDFVWKDLRQKSAIQIDRILALSGSWDFEVESVVFDGGATAYDTFVVHRKPRLRLRKRDGSGTVDAAVFGSVIQESGRYKLFSYVVNR